MRILVFALLIVGVISKGYSNTLECFDKTVGFKEIGYRSNKLDKLIPIDYARIRISEVQHVAVLEDIEFQITDSSSLKMLIIRSRVKSNLKGTLQGRVELLYEYDKSEEICLGTHLDKKEYLAFITRVNDSVFTIEIGDKSGFDKKFISELIK
jgi:HD-GYP domain-containing protein (c-di-GMP phosphodiesterase class II)